MSSSAVLIPGLIIAGRYRIEETLAGEGSAALLRATDTRAERGVALRMLPLGSGDDGERCTRQGKLAARLTHPNLARVLDFGTDEAAGVRYVASELGAGGTLAALLAQRGAPPLPLALRMLQEAAAGLAAAHAAGAVHGDLHPGMLWLSRGGGKLRVEVLGLGMDAAGAPPARATARYCSPERLRRARDLAPAADVFSLGAIAYEVLAGLPADWMTLLIAMAKGQSAAVPSPLALKPDLPPELADAVLRAVSASPADRWCDAGEFAAALAVPAAVPATPTIIPLAINVVREPAPRAETQPARTIPLAVPIVAAPADVLAAPAVIAEAAETLPLLEFVPEASPLEIVHAEAPPPVEIAPAEEALPTPDAAPAEPAPATRTSGETTLSHESALASTDLAGSLYIPPTIMPTAQSSAPGPIADVEPGPAIEAPQSESAALIHDAAAEFELTLIDAEYDLPTLPIAAAPVAMIAESALPATELKVIEEDEASAQSVPFGLITALPASEPAPLKKADRIPPQQADTVAPRVPVTPIVRYGRAKPTAKPAGGRGGLIAAGVVLAVLVAGGGLVAKTAIGGSSTDAAAARLASPALATASPGASTADPSAEAAAPAADEPRTTAKPATSAADEERRRAEEQRKQDQLRRDQQRRTDSIRAAQLASARQPAAQAAPVPIQPPTPPENRPAPQVAVAPPSAAAAPAPAVPARPRVDPSRVYRAGELDVAPALANRSDFGRVVARNYPSSANGAGSAVVEFVVLPNGTVDRSSIRVVEVSDPVFRRAAAVAAGAARFTPARVDGQPVRASVSIPLTWNQN